LQNIDEDKAAIKKGIDLLADHIFRVQTAQRVWPVDGQFDMGSFFADLHGKVTSAWDESKEGDLTRLTWVDPGTGEETSPGKGIPSGLMVTMVEIMYEVLGFCRAIGVEPGSISADLGVAYASDGESEASVAQVLEITGEEDDVESQ
jgi:hypothetical protein